MNLHLLWAILLGALLGSLADWLFAGVLFHHRYQRFPEVWRSGNERQRIVAAQALAVVTAAAFVLLAWKLRQTAPRGDIPASGFLAGHVGGEPVLLSRDGDAVHAVSGQCTHYGAPLAEGLAVG